MTPTNGKPTTTAPDDNALRYLHRKSTEECLEQEFNTLDAQRESAEAFIASQRQEGWTCLPERYDDGGYTGGNMDRPRCAKAEQPRRRRPPGFRTAVVEAPPGENAGEAEERPSSGFSCSRRSTASRKTPTAGPTAPRATSVTPCTPRRAAAGVKRQPAATSSARAAARRERRPQLRVLRRHHRDRARPDLHGLDEWSARCSTAMSARRSQAGEPLLGRLGGRRWLGAPHRRRHPDRSLARRCRELGRLRAHAMGQVQRYNALPQVESVKSNTAATSGRTFALAADISWAVGLALLVIGIVLAVLPTGGGGARLRRRAAPPRRPAEETTPCAPTASTSKSSSGSTRSGVRGGRAAARAGSGRGREEAARTCARACA